MLKQLDIGCGNTIRQSDGYEVFGVDIVDVGKSNVKVADLALGGIPYDDNTFDLVTAYDFLEHIPMVIYLNGQKRNAMIALFNEVYRVLKPDGIFYSQTPCYPSKMVFQDPTHVSVFTDETPHYFSGDYYGFHSHYQHTSRFELVERRPGDHMIMKLRAVKGLPEGAPYVLKYA